MATRTRYYTSALGASELKGIRPDDVAFSAGDLTTLDAEALHRVNALLLQVAGAVSGGTIIAEFMDDANPIDPIFVLIAEKIAASEAFKRWEQYNLGVASRDDQNRRRDSDRLREEVMRLALTVKSSKATVKTTLAIRYLGSTKEGGPIVGGPMREGSYFDVTEYVDAYGIRRCPSVSDPYFAALGY